MTHGARHSGATSRMPGRLRSALAKGALCALAISVGALPASSAAIAVAGDTDSAPITPGTRTIGEPELANCGTIYGLRLERPHNVERIDPVSGDSTVLFSMGDSARYLNGLALDRNTLTFWAVQQNGTGNPATVTTPSVFSYDTRTNTQKKYTGTKLLTPQPREGIVAGAFNPSSNVFYYGQLHDNSFYVYGFDAEAQKAIPGIIAVIEVGAYTNGDFAFDSAGRLYIAADGMLLVTQSALPKTGSEDPPRMVARGIAKLSDSPLGSGAFGSDGTLYVADGDGTVLTVDPSSGKTLHTSRLEPSKNRLSDFASCSAPRTLTLMKDLPEGRAKATDQFMLTIDGGGLASGNVGTTTGSRSGVQDHDFAAYAGPVAVKPGETYTLSELGVNGTEAGDYASRWSCSLGETVIAEGQGLEGSVTIPESPANGTDVACVFTNAIVGGLSASKSAAPASGTPVQANDTITYTLRFANSAATPAAVDTTDDLSGVLGNATMLQEPSSTSEALAVVRSGDTLAITGTLAAKSTATVSYTVRVHEKSERSSNTVTNILHGCASPEDCTTEHPVAALGVEKSAEAEIGVVNYTVTVTNTGGIAYTADKPATMTDNLAGLLKVGAVYRGDVRSSSGTASVVDDVLRWSGPLAVGESVTITYSINTAGVDVDVHTTLPNTACVPLAGQDPECASLVTPVPPATRETPACVGPDCADLLPEYTKVLEGVGTTLNADGEADYVVRIKNPYDELLHVELVDYLSDVLDDATIIGTPTVSVDTIAVDRTDAAAWVIHGELQPGETVQLRYRIKVHSVNAAGNRILNNYIVPPTVEKPTVCTPKAQEDQHCTHHTVPGPLTPAGTMSAGKSADPATGSPLHTGDLVTYTLSFVNGTSSAIDIDTYDDLRGVLNHAEIVMPPTASNSDLDAVLASDRILITGKLPAGSRTTITYAVRVLANDFRVTSEMVNTFAGCTPGETCETRHPIPPAKKPPKSPTSLPLLPSAPPGGSESPAPPAASLVNTGGGNSPAAWLAAVAILGGVITFGTQLMRPRWRK